MAVYYGELELDAHENVYAPAEDSFLLADNLGEFKGCVLDMGTGTGIQALTAAKRAEHVVGVDVNPEAVELARRNAESNDIDNADFMVSNLFSNVEGRFDLIIFNPPYLAAEDAGELGKAWSGGTTGVEVINRFIEEAGEYLTPEGRIMLLVSSINRLGKVKEKLADCGYDVEITAKEKIFFEELYVLSAFKR
ncbi:MAG: methyltransferase [Candidatus Altiarchaeales archaeon]|nr:methyltransferase [Candidatus Altiarchaeales archaeon]MBD3417308.1 methyltransferase [Candidatus Altiarchaeales archaeon]